MDHDIGAWLGGLLWVTLITIGTGFIHLHVVATLLFAFLLLIRLALAFLFQVDLLAASFGSGVLLGRRSSGIVSAGHFSVFTFNRSGALSLSLNLLLLLLLF